jgi:hypothetical protein
MYKVDRTVSNDNENRKQGVERRKHRDDVYSQTDEEEKKEK